MRHKVVGKDFEDKVEALMRVLESDEEGTKPTHSSMSSAEVAEGQLSQLHQSMFRNAATLYLYRTIYNATPRMVEHITHQVLTDTLTFLKLKGGSISLWPVFMVAVEACGQHDRAMVDRWLEYVCSLGINNRQTAGNIIREVWRRRDELAAQLGVEAADVVMDWRQVESELGMDLLLL